MKNFIFIAIVLFIVTSVFAEDNSQQEYINQGVNYIKSDNYQKAVEAFEIAVKANPNNADAHFGLGICYLRLGDNEAMTNPELVQKAVYSFRKALHLGINYPEVHYNLGLGYLALNDKEAAIREYDVLKDRDNKLANQLLVRIDDYKPPKDYTKIGETGSLSPVNSSRPTCGPGEKYYPAFGTCGKAESQVIGHEETKGMRELREDNQREAKLKEMRKLRKAIEASSSHSPSGAIDVTTGEYYPPAAGGIINPRTGQFYPDVGSGYIDPQNGQFMPKIK